MTKFNTGFYDAVMMKGGTKISFWFAQYIMDVFLILLILPILEVFAYLCGVIMPGIWFIYIQYAFA